MGSVGETLFRAANKANKLAVALEDPAVEELVLVVPPVMNPDNPGVTGTTLAATLRKSVAELWSTNDVDLESAEGDSFWRSTPCPFWPTVCFCRVASIC